MPALTPNPTKNRREDEVSKRAGQHVPAGEQRRENEKDPDAAARTKNAAMRQPVPTCDMTR